MPTPPMTEETMRDALRLVDEFGSISEAARQVGMPRGTLQKRVNKAKRAGLHLSPGAHSAMEGAGLNGVEIKGGWRRVQHEDGSFDTVRWSAPSAEETRDFVEAIQEVLGDIKPLPPVTVTSHAAGKGVCNFVPLADLHLGGEYGNPEYEEQLNDLIDRTISRLPPAEKAHVIELGDLLDANDHKGLTPGGANPCDVVRDDHWGNMKLGLRIMDRVIQRLMPNHAQIEVDMVRGNHDETAYMGILMGLIERYRDNPQVKINDSIADYRIIVWGECGILPNHGDKAKWEALRDVWITDFADEWAATKTQRIILTAHFHSLKVQELAGVTCEGCRSTAKGNRYVHLNGWRSKRGLCAITLHKTEGEIDRTPSILRKAA